jgi:putative hemolysin
VTDILLWGLVAVLVLIVAFLAMAETALTKMTKVRAASFEENGRRGARQLVRLTNAPERWLTPLLFVIMLIHFTISTVVAVLVKAGLPWWGTALVIVAEVSIVFVIAESAPKTWALLHSDRAALLMAPFIRFMTSFPPLQWIASLLVWIANVILPGKGLPHGPATTEQELLAMADAALEEDVIEHGERSMIHSVIEFGDTVVREVMVPRPDMVIVSATATVDDAMGVAIEHGLSRLPVTRDSKDDIAGIAYVKDLMRAHRDGRKDVPVVQVARPARFAPEGKPVADLMREMQGQKFHMAIVLDEYGGTAGLVTLEDLLEELVGEIVDEYDTEEAQVERLPNGDVRVNARMLIDEVNELLDVAWPSEDWDSIGGLFLNLLGRPAAEGEQVRFEGHTLRAERVKGRRIGRVRISRVPVDADDTGDGSGDDEGASA